MEQVFILILLVMFAAIQGLAQWRRGIANSRNATVPTDSELDADGYPLDPFEAVEIEPARIEPPRIGKPKASQLEPQRHLARGTPRQLARASSQSGALAARPPAFDAGVRDAGPRNPGLRHTDLIPQTPTELRRAIALVAIFGPPRALDPPA